MKTCFASMAAVAMAEETVLLQVKTSKDPMMGTDMPMPPPPPMEDPAAMAGSEMPPPPPPMPNEEPPLQPPAAFEDDMETFEDDMEEFDVTPFTTESIDEFVEANEGLVEEFFEFGDVEVLEEAIIDFCESDPNAPEGCAAAATELAEDAFESMSEHHQEHPPPAEASHCEQMATWEHHYCDKGEPWMCQSSGMDMLHLNALRICEHNEGCEDGDWHCYEMGWKMEDPPCQWPMFKTEYGWSDHLDIGTAEEVPDGPPDNFCMVDQDCINDALGPDGWDQHIEDWGMFWEGVDACLCAGTEGMAPNRDSSVSWYVDFVADICGPKDAYPMDPDMYGTYDPDMYGTDATGDETYDMPALDIDVPVLQQKNMQRRFNLARKKGATKKQALIASGMIRHVNMKELAKKKILKAAKLI